jgi:hypothetical protein
MLDIASQLASAPVIRDARLFPRPFFGGIAVVGFAPQASPLLKQLVLDRLQGEVVAVRPRGNATPDYIVRVGSAWRDSLLQITPQRRLEREVARFGYLLVPGGKPLDPAPLPVAVDTSLIRVHEAKDQPDDRLVHRRLVLIHLANATPAERDEVAAVANGRWRRSSSGRIFEEFELTGTRSDVNRTLAFLHRLPQVDFAVLNIAFPLDP